MRQEFNDEVVIGKDLMIAADAIGRMLKEWFESMNELEQAKIGVLVGKGFRLGMMISLGEDRPPGAAIVGVDKKGEAAVLAEFDYMVKSLQ